MAEHHCHAYACNASVPPRMLMCRRHWRMVPRALQRRLLDAYRPGQERRMNPSVEYLHAAADCVRDVAAQEGHDAETVENDPAVAGYMAWVSMIGED